MAAYQIAAIFICDKNAFASHTKTEF